MPEPSLLPANIYDPNCPSRHALDLISDKWTVLIMMLLSKRTVRYNALRRDVGGISNKMLTQTLRKLENANLIQRTVYPVIPPHVEYQLTALGETLVTPVMNICSWAEEHRFEVRGENELNRAEESVSESSA